MTNTDSNIELAKAERRKRIKRRRAVTRAIIIFLFLCLVALVGLDFYLTNEYKKQKAQIQELAEENEELVAVMSSDEYVTREEYNKAVEEAGKTDKEAIKNEYKELVLKMFENGDSVLRILESIYNDKIVVPDNGTYFFYDILENLQKHGLDFDKFIYPEEDEETGLYDGDVAYDDPNVTLKKGVDVSKFQGEIEWDKVKDQGYEFAFIRLGYRGYETGKIAEDDNYQDNIEGCNEAGIDTGVYFFTEAKTEAEGIEEAEFVLDLIDGYRIDMPIVLDVEQSANTAKSRTKNLTQEDRTKIVLAFCDRIEQAGYDVMIYGNLKSMLRMVDLEQLEKYDKWFAYYRFPLRYPYKFRIWQYTSTGKVEGIKGDVDINIAFY